MSKLPSQASECGLKLLPYAFMRALQETAQDELVTLQRLLNAVEVIQQVILVHDAAQHEAQSILNYQFVLEDHGFTFP